MSEYLTASVEDEPFLEDGDSIRSSMESMGVNEARKENGARAAEKPAVERQGSERRHSGTPPTSLRRAGSGSGSGSVSVGTESTLVETEEEEGETQGLSKKDSILLRKKQKKKKKVRREEEAAEMKEEVAEFVEEEDAAEANAVSGMKIIQDFAPALLVNLVQEEGNEVVIRNPPFQTDLDAVVMFLDLSGFTTLTEKLSVRGSAGAEMLGFYLNRYFERLVKMIARSGGDVFKFAGDAMIVIWHHSLIRGSCPQDIQRMACEATQCSLHIQEELHGAELAENVTFSVKVGIGAGKVGILHLGGKKFRLEHLLCGKPVLDAFHSESLCEPGSSVVSPSVWEMAKDYFKGTVLPDGFVRVEKNVKRIRNLSLKRPVLSSNMAIHLIQRYIPASIKPYMTCHLSWSAELRQVSILFVNLGISAADLLHVSPEELESLQKRFAAVQEETYLLEGSVNKFLLDDKGSTILIAFGLPPVTHANDPMRAVTLAMNIADSIRRLESGKECYIGITTGTAFCGPIGSGTRREYSVLGDIVNTSARLMQTAKVNKEKLLSSVEYIGKILCDQATRDQSKHLIELRFHELEPIKLKGKAAPVAAFQPGWLNMYPLLEELHSRLYAFPMEVEDPKRRMELPWSENTHLELLFSLDNLIYSRGNFPSTVVLAGQPQSGKTEIINRFTQALQKEYNSTRFHVIGSTVKCLPSQNHPGSICGMVDKNMNHLNIIRVSGLFSRSTHQGAFVWGQVILALNYIAKRAELPGAHAQLLIANAFSVAWLPRSTVHGSGEEFKQSNAPLQHVEYIFDLLRQVIENVGHVVLILDDAQWMSPLDMKITKMVSHYFEVQATPQNSVKMVPSNLDLATTSPASPFVYKKVTRRNSPSSLHVDESAIPKVASVEDVVQPAKAFSGFFMVVSTWPFHSLPYEPVFQPPSVDFLEMVHSINKILICPHKLSILDTELLLMDILNAEIVAEDALQGIWKMTRGHRSITRSTIHALHEKGFLKVKRAKRSTQSKASEQGRNDTPMQDELQTRVKLSSPVPGEGVFTQSFLDACQSPDSSRMISSILDKLSPGDQVLLKCASVLCRGTGLFGAYFDLGMLMAIFPLKDIQSTAAHNCHFNLTPRSTTLESEDEKKKFSSFNRKLKIRSLSQSFPSKGTSETEADSSSMYKSVKSRRKNIDEATEGPNHIVSFNIPEVIVDEPTLKGFIRRIERLQRFGLIETVQRPASNIDNPDASIESANYCIPFLPMLEEDKFSTETRGRKQHHIWGSQCFRFSNLVVRDVVYNRASFAQRRRLHLSAAHTLEEIVRKETEDGREKRTATLHRNYALASLINNFYNASDFLQAKETFEKYEAKKDWFPFNPDDLVSLSSILSPVPMEDSEMRQNKSIVGKARNSRIWASIRKPSRAILMLPDISTTLSSSKSFQRRQSFTGPPSPQSAPIGGGSNPLQSHHTFQQQIHSSGSSLVGVEDDLGKPVPIARDRSTGSLSTDSETSSPGEFPTNAFPKRSRVSLADSALVNWSGDKSTNSFLAMREALHEMQERLAGDSTIPFFRRAYTLKHNFGIKKRFSLTEQDGWWDSVVRDGSTEETGCFAFLRLKLLPYGEKIGLGWVFRRQRANKVHILPGGKPGTKKHPVSRLSGKGDETKEGETENLQADDTLTELPPGIQHPESMKIENFPSLSKWTAASQTSTSSVDQLQAIKSPTAARHSLVALMVRMGSSLENLLSQDTKRQRRPQHLEQLSESSTNFHDEPEFLMGRRGSIHSQENSIPEDSVPADSGKLKRKISTGMGSSRILNVRKSKVTPSDESIISHHSDSKASTSEEHHLYVYATYESLDRLFQRYVVGSLTGELYRLTYNLDSWDFDMFQFERFSKAMPLFSILRLVFAKYETENNFRITQAQINAFAQKVEMGYPANPYHNSLHAADVVQASHVLIQTVANNSHTLDEQIHSQGKTGPFSPIDWMSLFLAAAVHDLRHPGVTNSFLVATNSKLALNYPAPHLEHYHFSVAKPLIIQLFQNESFFVRNKVLDRVKQLVISTSLNSHQSSIHRLRGRFPTPITQALGEEEKNEVVDLLIMCADVSNCARNLELYKRWVVRIADEFMSQGELEKKANLPVTPFMDRFESKMQLQFIEGVVRPLFDLLEHLYPSTSNFLTQVQDNYFFWKHANRKQNLRIRHSLNGSLLDMSSDSTQRFSETPSRNQISSDSSSNSIHSSSLVFSGTQFSIRGKRS